MVEAGIDVKCQYMTGTAEDDICTTGVEIEIF